MAWLAIEAVKERPLEGVGAGGYRAWTHACVVRRGWDPGDVPGHNHFHSAPLHNAATTGLIGLLLASLAAGVALYGGMTGLGPEGEVSGVGSYAAGPAFALLGLLLAGLFDPVQLNAQTAAMMATLMGLCLVSRPSRMAPQPTYEPPAQTAE
jgi:O-antigen ligase